MPQTEARAAGSMRPHGNVSTGLLDPGSFTEFIGPSERVQSPHLKMFDLPSAFDDGVVIGRGTLDGKPVLVAAQEGQFMGGTFAEVSGAELVWASCERRAIHKDLPQTVLLLMDSGGVRLQEANAGGAGGRGVDAGDRRGPLRRCGL